MTALQIAKEQCSNYEKDGTCAGLDFDNQSKHFRFAPAGQPCVLCTKGVRCTFFETAVMPMDRSALSSLNRQAWEDALRNYRRSANVTSDKGKRICPICNERHLEPRKRFCYVCANSKRQETKRRARGV